MGYGTVTLVVGVPVSLSGQFQAQGRQALAGLQAWVRDANSVAAGAFKLVHHDDASDVSTVRDVTRRLILQDRVDILIGPYSSALTSAAAEVSEGFGKLLWNQGGASDAVYQQGYRWVVGVLTPANRYLAGLLPMVLEAGLTVKTVALARAATGEFPRAVCSGVEEAAKGLGITVSSAIEFPATTGDFIQVIQELKAGEPDVVVAVGRVGNDIQFAKQLAGSDSKAKAVAVVAAGIQDFRDRLGESADGYLGPSQWEPGVWSTPDYGPTGEEVMSSLQSSGHQHVDYPMAQAYAAGLVVQRCLEETGSAESGALREAAGRLSFTTFYGGFEIDGSGRQVGRETLLVQWQEGHKVVVWPPGSARRALVHPWR